MEVDDAAVCIRESYTLSSYITVYLGLCRAAYHGDTEFILALLNQATPNQDTKNYERMLIWREIIHPPIVCHHLPLTPPIRIAHQAGQKSAVVVLLRCASNFVKNSSQVLNISRMALKGEYLSALDDASQMEDVQTLSLVQNPLGTIDHLPLSPLANLTHINANMCGLKTVPPELFLLPSISEIKLSENSLVEIPNLPPGTHTPAVFLYLSYNSLNHIPESFVAPKLEHLELQCNCFTEIPRAVLSMDKLNFLKVSHNPSLHSIPFELGQMPELNRLIMDKLEIHNLPSIVAPSMGLDYLKPSKMSLVEHRHFEVVFVGSDQSQNAHSDLVNILSHLSPPFSIMSCTTPSRFLATMEAILKPPQLFVFVVSREVSTSFGMSEFRPVLQCLSVLYKKSSVVVACCRNSPESLVPDRPLHPKLLSEIEELAREFPSCSITAKRVEITIKSSVKWDIKHFITSLEECGNEIANVFLVPHFNSVFTQYFKLNTGDEANGPTTTDGNCGKPPIFCGPDLGKAVSGIQEDVCLPDAHWLLDMLEKCGKVTSICNKSGIILNRQWICDFVNCAVNVVHISAFVRPGFLPYPALSTIFSSAGFKHVLPDVLIRYLVNTGVAFPIRQETFFVPHALSSIPKDVPLELTCSRVLSAPILPPGFWNRLLAYITLHVDSLLEACLSESQSGSFIENFETVKCDYWNCGVVVCKGYEKFCFALRGYELAGTHFCEVVVSLTPSGTKLLTKLFNVVTSLLRNWFPCLWPSVSVHIPCSKCRLTRTPDVHHHSFVDTTRCLLQHNTLYCPLHQESDVYPLSVLPDLLGEQVSAHCSIQCTGVGGSISSNSNVGRKTTVLDEVEFVRQIHLLLEINSIGSPRIASVVSIDFGTPLSYSLDIQGYVPLRSLLEDKKEPLNRHVALQILIQTTEALQNLHSRGIAHRNLSIDSVVVKLEGSGLIANTKLVVDENVASSTYSDTFRGKCGTFPAPEMLLDNETNEYDGRVDVYSLAFLAYHLLTGREFHSRLSLHQKPALEPLAAVAPLLVTTICRCWLVEPGKRPFPSDVLQTFLQPQTILPTMYKFVTGEKNVVLSSSVITTLPVDDVRSGGGALAVFYYSQSDPNTILLQHFSTEDLSVKVVKPISCDQVHHIASCGSYLFFVHSRKTITVVSTRGFKIVKKLELDSNIMSTDGDGTKRVIFGLANGAIACFVLGESEDSFAVVDQRCIKAFTSDPVTLVKYVGDSFVVASPTTVTLCTLNTLNLVKAWDISSVLSVAVPFESGSSQALGEIWAASTNSMVLSILLMTAGRSDIERVDVSQLCIEDCMHAATAISSLLAVGDVVWVGNDDGSVLIMDVLTRAPLSLVHLHTQYPHPSCLTMYPLPKVSLLHTETETDGSKVLSQPTHFTVLSTGCGLCESVFTQRHRKLVGTSPISRSGLYVTALTTMTSAAHFWMIETRRTNFPGEDFQLCYVNHTHIVKSHSVAARTPLAWPSQGPSIAHSPETLKRIQNIQVAGQGRVAGSRLTVATLGSPTRRHKLSPTQRTTPSYSDNQPTSDYLPTELWYRRNDPFVTHWHVSDDVQKRTATFIGSDALDLKHKMNVGRKKLPFPREPPSVPRRPVSQPTKVRDMGNVSPTSTQDYGDPSAVSDGGGDKPHLVSGHTHQLTRPSNSVTPPNTGGRHAAKRRSRSTDDILEIRTTGGDHSGFDDRSESMESDVLSEPDLATVVSMEHTMSSSEYDSGYNRPSEMTSEFVSLYPPQKGKYWIYEEQPDDKVVPQMEEALRIRKKSKGTPKSLKTGDDSYVHISPSGDSLTIPYTDPEMLNPISDEGMDRNSGPENEGGYIFLGSSGRSATFVEDSTYEPMTSDEQRALTRMIAAKKRAKEDKNAHPAPKPHTAHNLPGGKGQTQYVNLANDPSPEKGNPPSVTKPPQYVNFTTGENDSSLKPVPPPRTTSMKDPYEFFIPRAIAAKQKQQKQQQQQREKEGIHTKTPTVHSLSSDEVSITPPVQPTSVKKDSKGTSAAKRTGQKYVNLNPQNAVAPPPPPKLAPQKSEVSKQMPNVDRVVEEDVDHLGYTRMTSSTYRKSPASHDLGIERSSSVSAHVKVADSPHEDLEATISPTPTDGSSKRKPKP